MATNQAATVGIDFFLAAAGDSSTRSPKGERERQPVTKWWAATVKAVAATFKCKQFPLCNKWNWTLCWMKPSYFWMQHTGPELSRHTVSVCVWFTHKHIWTLPDAVKQAWRRRGRVPPPNDSWHSSGSTRSNERKAKRRNEKKGVNSHMFTLSCPFSLSLWQLFLNLNATVAYSKLHSILLKALTQDWASFTARKRHAGQI